MGERSGIEWTDATVNFWWGCTKVGPGCDFCYAETTDKRYGGAHWGLNAPRRKIKGAVALIHKLDNYYAGWAADAICAVGNAKFFRLPVPKLMIRQRVFIQSMSDLFDIEVDLPWFEEAWAHIEACNRLYIQIVTKRISAVEKRLSAIGSTVWPEHAGLLITVVNQQEADRDIPRLLALKAKLGIPWVGLSVEPMLGNIIIPPEWLVKIDQVICGGESGPKARPMHPDWARSLRDQCAAAGVPFFFKQWGEWLPGQNHVYPGFRDGRRVAHWQDGGWGQRTASRPDANYVMWAPDGTMLRSERKAGNYFEVAAWAQRVGKPAAGRLLDGVEHDGMPRAMAEAS